MINGVDDGGGDFGYDVILMALIHVFAFSHLQKLESED